MARRFTAGDIEAIITALRPRLSRFIQESGPGGGDQVPAHSHHARDIGVEPAGESWTGYIDEDILQDVIEEIDDEKLARSGVQPMRGDLDMDDGAGPYSIFDIESLILTGGTGEGRVTGVRNLDMTVSVLGEGNITGVRDIDMTNAADGEGDITGVRDVDFSNAIVGEGVINNPRVIHMAGDLGDGEALIDGLDKVKFNATATQAIIEDVSREEWNTGVTPGTHYTRTVGFESWSTLEDTLIVLVQTNGTPFALAAGWDVIQAVDNSPE